MASPLEQFEIKTIIPIESGAGAVRPFKNLGLVIFQPLETLKADNSESRPFSYKNRHINCRLHNGPASSGG